MIEIKRINLETSLVCNTDCRFCLRTRLKERGFKLPKKFLDLNKFFALDFENTNLQEIIICGSFGEPTLHPEFFRLIKFLNSKNFRYILHTNGAVYSESWWKKLAELTKPKNNVIFMLEGIDDKTHKPYRQTSFDRLTKNIKAFTNAGGNATASMFVFKHNEHIIEQYKDLVLNKLNCSNVIIKSSRHYDDTLRKPISIKVQDDKFCFPKDFGEIMVDINGGIYPCCYMYNVNFIYGTKYKSVKTFKDLQKHVICNFLGELEICNYKCKNEKTRN